MPTPNLPSANSIVDFLKTSGQDSSFSARRKLYSASGFDKRLGDYVGSATQNTNLLKSLQTTPATNAVDTIQKSPVVNANQKEAFSMSPINLTGGMGGVQTTTPAMATLNRAGYAEFKPAPTGAVTGKDLPDAVNNFNTQVAAKLGRPAPATPTPATPAATPATTTPAVTHQQTDTQTQQALGISASSIYSDASSDPGESDLVNGFLNSPEGQLFLDRQKLAGMNAEAIAESTKAALEAKYKQEKDTLEERLTANGLAFSGIRGSKVKALADSLAASTLEVDREFASKLLDANLDLRDAILKGVADLAKQAQDGRKEAIQQLNAIGYAVIGNQLVPTLSARSAERADRQLELSEARLQLAEEAGARAEANFQRLYGADALGGFSAVQQLIALNPTATEADIRATIRSNPQIFGQLSESAINDAVKLTGIPPALMPTVAQAYLDTFDTALTSKSTAKTKAAEALRATGGVIKVKDSDGKERIYTLTTDQLNDLIAQVNAL